MHLPSVLLTGGTGSVGAFVLDQLLANGNKVTAVVRSLEKSYAFLEHKYRHYVNNEALSIIEIPDLTVPNVFDAPAELVEAIIHVATPLAYSDFEHSMIEPTHIIDDSILSAAAKSGSVKRVIITGSIVSTMMLPSGFMRAGIVSEKDFNASTHEQGLENVMNAYAYAKTQAEHKAWAFMEREKPDFDLVVLLAPSITGRNIQQSFVPSKTFIGGTGGIFRALFDVDTPGFTFPYFMDVEDVAAIHVMALDPTVPGNERYLFHAPGKMSANLLATKVRETFPELRDRVPVAGQGDSIPVPLVDCDISKFDKVFGHDWTGWWESARGTVEDIIRLEAPRHVAATA